MPPPARKAVTRMSLDKDDISYLKEVFVQKDDCSKTVALENEKISDLKVLLAKTNTKMSLMITLVSIIGTPVVALCVKLLFNA